MTEMLLDLLVGVVGTLGIWVPLRVVWASITDDEDESSI